MGVEGSFRVVVEVMLYIITTTIYRLDCESVLSTLREPPMHTTEETGSI